MRARALIAVVVAAGCGGGDDNTPPGDASVDPDATADAGGPPDAELRLDPTPGLYHESCDGSGAAAIDATHFIDVYDEDQVLRVYARGTDGGPVQSVDISADLGLATDDEADLEELARSGDRIYAITSHGRDTSGMLQRSRYRFAAIDVAGTVPALALAVAGSSSTLLDDLLVAANWDAPDLGVIDTLDVSSDLGDQSDPDLPPELEGTNIEGLALAPSATNPGRLVIGFRNPRPAGRAIVVTLENADAVVGGATAHFGDAALWDLDGLGIRAMAWSEPHGAMLIVAGPHASSGPFRLYRWTGDLADPPAMIQDITPPESSAPEAIVIYPLTRDIQITFDQGDANVGGTPCKLAPAADRVFTDLILSVP